ncbi:MAG: segregation/condensation protein A [Planctomycetaceae bacterium]
METGYRVKLDLYSGPLDLLLYLVRRHEVDILELPIAAITTQFLEYLDVLIMIDIDEIGEFLVTASTLVELKSRLVLPRPEEEIEEDEAVEGDHEMSSALVQRLLQYKRFKDASQLLQEKAAIWQEHYSRQNSERPRRGRKPSDDLIKEVELWDLVSALSRLLRVKQIDTNENQHDDTPISVFMERIRNRVIEEGEIRFSDFFEGERPLLHHRDLFWQSSVVTPSSIPRGNLLNMARSGFCPHLKEISS